jgi:hypothetical protein
VKVNAEVDQGMVRIITALSSIPGLQTIQSCEGTGLPQAYVYFWYGTWDQICKLVFGEILPSLRSSQYGLDVSASVEVYNGSKPTAKIEFNAAALQKATAAIEDFVSIWLSCARNSESARDTEYRVLGC